MLFTDISSDRAVNAFSKAGFMIIKQGKHIGMSDGKRKITIPRHNKDKPIYIKINNKRCRFI